MNKIAMSVLIKFLLLTLAIYLAISGLYQLILALASKTSTKDRFTRVDKQNRFLILVPAYKEDAVIVESTRRNMAIKFNYHHDLFDYLVIGDGLKTETEEALRKLGASVLTVRLKHSTKVKSLQAAIASMGEQYNGVIILDADNVVSPGFLSKANQYLNQGYEAIQGQRVADGVEQTISLLDGLSEAANNAMLCKGANELGLSSKLSGSGMVFSYALFKRTIMSLKAIGGFDKELELNLTSQGIFIKYAEDLTVADQKVQNYSNYERQRGRWIESQFSFFKKSLKPAFSSLRAGNIDHFHKAMQLVLPPRALAPFALTLLVVIGYFSSTSILITGTAGLITNLSSYFISIPKALLFGHFGRIVLAMPRLALSTIVALTWVRRSKREFLHTQHQLARS